jgi:alcohol dehydrogenase
MENFVYYNPVKLLHGTGQIGNLAKEILPFGRKVLLVYGQHHAKATGLYETVIAQLAQEGMTHFELEGVHPNPRVSLVRQGAELCRREGIDFILAVGGGSVCDTAKGVSMAAKADFDIWTSYEDFHRYVMHGDPQEDRHMPNAVIPMGVVMTKAGTGSDFDYTSVLSNHDTREKLMVITKVMYPRFSIQDPALTASLPVLEVACGVADIMTHYFEQYFTSSANTEILDRTKEAGIRTVMESGRRAFNNPADQVAQGNLLYCAGWACSDQSMCGVSGEWTAHMIEHEISALTDLNHGNGMAIVFLSWMRYVLENIPVKFAQFAQAVFEIPRNGRNDSDLGLAAIEKTERFWRSLDIPLSWREVGVDTTTLHAAAKQAVRFGPLGGFVRRLEERDVRIILENGY